ncbi:hypothetical protein R80B4_03018 [Fibrobacteres bacterium R8-0-B4]
MVKLIIRLAAFAVAISAAVIGCVQVSDVTGGRVDEFLIGAPGDTSRNDSSIVAGDSLIGITAVYTQGTAIVYANTPLNNLKAGLAVTARYADNTTRLIPAADYQLSGELAVGTSTITVVYKGQTAAFTVTVTQRDVPSAPLVGISAVYDSTAVVYFGTEIDALKDNLTVTANYSDGTVMRLDASEYELFGKLTYPTSAILVMYGNESGLFSVRPKVHDVRANLYGKAPPILPSDTPVDLSLVSGSNIIDKAFNRVNASPGTYTFVLESDLDMILTEAAYTVSLTQSDIKLTILGQGAERTVRNVTSSAPMRIVLGGTGQIQPSGVELTLGNNVSLSNVGVIVYDGVLTMESNANTDGNSNDGAVTVMGDGSFIMRDNALIRGGGVTMRSGSAVFTMEGNASVRNCSVTAFDGAVNIAAGTFTMRGNASVRENDGCGVYLADISATNEGLYGYKTVVTMQDNAQIYGNAGTIGGVYVGTKSEFIMEGDASAHGHAKGGIYVSGGTLTMKDRASVYGSASGSGVRLSGGRFAMSGNASIYGNTAGSVLDMGNGETIIASGEGAGVKMSGGSDFTMSGNALIYGNAAIGSTGRGGGVYVGYNCTFTMSGGTIYGNNASPETYKNTAGQSGAALFADNGVKTVKYGNGDNIVGAGNGADFTITGK